MPISPVDLFVTKGYTREGLPYKKSNAAKTVLTTSSIALGIKSLKPLQKDTFEASKKAKVAKELTIVALLASFGFTLGSIIDGIVNKFSSKASFDKYQISKDSGRYAGELNTHQG